MLKNTFTKILYKKKIKKLINAIETDLYFNQLSSYPPYQTISLVCHENVIYQFRLSDLINMWLKSLNHSENLFCKPHILKNPYTNLPFCPTNLYNIYIGIQNSKYHIPHLIHLFIQNYCNIDKFMVNAYTILKDTAIDNYIKNGHTIELMESVNNMMHEFKKTVDYIYFPENLSYIRKKRVVKLLKYILKNYIYGTFGCNPLKKREAYSTTKTDLKSFFENNPFDNYTLQHIPRLPAMPPPPPPQARRNRRSSIFDPTVTPSIAFSLPPPPFNPDDPHVPITIQEITSYINETDARMNENNNRQIVRPYTLQLNAFRPTRELPRTPENNTNNNNTARDSTNIRPFSLRLFN